MLICADKNLNIILSIVILIRTTIPMKGLKNYKMSKIEYINGKRKIHLINLDQIYMELKIHDDRLFPKFLEKKLSTNVSISKYKVSLSNKISIKTIIDCFYEFVEYFVLCQECKSPDTSFILENKKLYICCHTCGIESKIIKNDITKKIIKMIKKN